MGNQLETRVVNSDTRNSKSDPTNVKFETLRPETEAQNVETRHPESRNLETRNLETRHPETRNPAQGVGLLMAHPKQAGW